MYRLIIVLLLFAACNNNASNSEATSDSIATEVQDTSATAIIECYYYYNNQDTVSFSLMPTGGIIRGDLVYDFNQKDRNTGTFEGSRMGDTLLAKYTFMSEGVQSIREVAFLKRGESYTEGFGETEQKNGEVVFKNRSQLKFENGLTLVKGPCAK